MEYFKIKENDGKKFRRQSSIDKYIVDFCCSFEKMVVEFDGAPHGEYHKIQKDEIRDQNTNQPPRPERLAVCD